MSDSDLPLVEYTYQRIHMRQDKLYDARINDDVFNHKYIFDN